MYDQYQNSKYKWLVRIVISALLIYFIAEMVIAFGRNWLMQLKASKFLMELFGLVESSFLWLVRGAATLFGGICGTVYNWIVS
jgi:hypothetical protein